MGNSESSEKHEKQFKGFRYPTENWFRLPNEWTDITAGIQSLAELKVVEYVLRHTWGYHEPGRMKRISTDEFMNGRRQSKRNGGGRLDNGTGLSDRSISNGLKLAIEHGFLEVEVDDTDKGRIVKSYRLSMAPPPVESIPQDKGFTSPPLNSTVPPVESTPPPVDFKGRTWKDTLRKKEQSLSAPTVTDRPCVSPSPKRKKSKPSKFDFRATDELIRIVSTHVKVNCKSNRNEWANQFRLLREWDGVPKADIRRTLEWYGRHIGEEYVPEAFSAAAFRRKFKDGKFASAMRRSKDEDSCGDEEDREMDIACEVRAWMENNLGWNSNQEAFDEDVDKALEALGYGAGAIDYQYV